MASEEDQEVFEITDFTTATEWERFIARVEEVIHEWKLTTTNHPRRSLRRGEISSGTWTKTVEEICFADTRFNMTHHKLLLEEEKEVAESPDEPVEDPLPLALEDMMSMENDFPYRAHCLARWYGVREFVVLSPVVYTDSISSESRAKLLLSSICIALNNGNCQVPMFVQIHQPHESYYLGVCEGGSVRITYEMVHLKRAPKQCNFLTGLLDIFKAKLASPGTSVPIIVSVRFTYVLQDWTEFAWPQQPPDFDLMMGEVGVTDLSELPFGACEDPVRELHLSTTWPCLSEDVVVDSDVITDLDPMQAPVWTVRVHMSEQPQCLLNECLTTFLNLCHCRDSTDYILGKNATDPGDANYAQPLDRLTNVLPLAANVSSVMNHSKRHLQVQRESVPIPSEQLQPLLFFLFPDAKHEESAMKMYNLDDDDEDAVQPTATESPSEPKKESKLSEILRTLKAAPPDSLTYRIALCLCQVNHSYKGLEALAYLWHEIFLEMRFRWEIACMLPGLEAGVPNLGCSLLHQKLQMLNCCIERRRAREQRQRRASWASMDRRLGIAHDSSTEEDEEEEDDEFFECDDRPSSSVEATSEGSFRDSLTHQPEGRLRRCGDLRLLNHPDQPLYIPITQEPTPMTEDLLEEQAEVLVQLGTDAEGAQLRAKMQSACLLSDMEAFKAANPECCLEDFVRWYSPRDWIQEDSGKGHLSARMLLPGNVWEEAWDTAKSVPVRRQKRLFDDTKEAEKVLRWMEFLTPAQVALQVLPVLIHAALTTIAKAEDPLLQPAFSLLVEQAAERATKITRNPRPDPKKYEEVIALLAKAEVLVARAQSLRTKFGAFTPNSPAPLESLVADLLDKPEVVIKGGSRSPAGAAVHKLFVRAQRSTHLLLDDSPTHTDSSSEEGVPPSSFSGGRRQSFTSVPDFPKPAGREYLLRTSCARPAPYSTPTPQRMFCVLQPEDVRIAGAFSCDTTFQ